MYKRQVLVCIGAVGAIHRLLRSDYFRHRCNLCKCGHHRSTAKQESANGYTQEAVELCEATIHWGAVCLGECAAIVGSLPRTCNGSWPTLGNIALDIGYFLTLMTEKNASAMFLTTGAPVYIKIEGKLYPLGNTGLPAGMVKVVYKRQACR